MEYAQKIGAPGSGSATIADGGFDSQQLAAEFHATRNRNSDTAHERGAVQHASRSNDMFKQLLTQKVMEEVVQDKFTMAGIQEAVESCNLPGRELGDDENSEDEDSDRDNDDEDGNALDNMRRRRLEQLKKKQVQMAEWKAKGHGQYEEIVESDFLKTVIASERSVVHFYHKNFETCKVMDMHLRRIAPKIMGIKFMTINAEKTPFFVEKLRVKTLPTVIFFKDGIAVHHMVGFNEVGGNEEFKTSMLANVLYGHEMCEEHPDMEEDDDRDD